MVEEQVHLEPARGGGLAGAGRFLSRVFGAAPAAFFTAALLTDYVYSQSGNLFWQYFSVWLITAALICGAFGALGLLFHLFGSRRDERSWGHPVVYIVAMLVGLLNAFVHSRDGWTAVVPEGIILSAITVLLLAVASWLGHRARHAGDRVYGVPHRDREHEPAPVVAPIRTESHIDRSGPAGEFAQ